MRLRNATPIPDALVREIIRFVKPHNIGGFDVRLGLSRGKHIKGRAYWAGSGYHDRACPFINCYLGSEATYPTPPIRKRHKGGYLPMPYFKDATEAMTYLIAHELRHLWQAKVKRGWRVWGAKGQFSERDCDAYAIRQLRAWRRAH